jgi:hypothetical protein
MRSLWYIDMKQPCHRTLELVVRLETVLRGSKPLFGWRKKEEVDCAVAIINELEKVGDWSLVPYLVQFILQPEAEIAESAGRCIEAVLKDVRPSRLSQIDQRLRGGLYTLRERMGQWQALKSFEENNYVATFCA